MKTKTPLTLLTILGLAAILMMPNGIAFGAVINGDNNDNELVGGPGPDTINGKDGNDEIDGQGGKDNIKGGNGEDSIRGGDGDDQISGQAGDDYLVGDDGVDSIDGNAGNDEIFGGAGDDDTLDGGNGDDEVSGGSGNDRIKGGSGNDSVFGDSGDDVITGGPGNDFVSGGPGDDDIFSGDGDDILKGDVGNDRLVGTLGPGITTFDGGEKDDDFDGKFNEDPVDGIDNDGDGLIDEDPDDPADQDICWWDGGPTNQIDDPDGIPNNGDEVFGDDILVQDDFGNNTCETVFLVDDTANPPPSGNPASGGKGKGGGAPTPPGAINDLSAVATGDATVSLSWTEPSPGDDPIDEYVVEKDDGSGFTEIATISAPAIGHVDSSATNGVLNNYRVAAVSAVGQGDFSNEASATPGVPGAIDDLSATATDSEEVTLNWSGPIDNGFILTQFVIQRDTGSGFTALTTIAAPATSYVDSTAINDQSNTYQIAAENSEGQGPFSNVDSATPTAAPTVELFSIDVTITGQGGQNGKNNIIFTVLATDTGAIPVAGALISLDLTLNGGVHDSVSGTTDASGTVVFSVKKAPDGDWNVASVSGSHSDPLIDWDGIAPVVADFPKP